VYFKNRGHAGKLLSAKLSSIPFDQFNTVIIALPRGGVPVGFEIAKKLNLPLDIILVKKIGTPSNPELAIGAVSEGDEVYYNNELLKYFGYDIIDIQPFKLQAINELQKTAAVLRAGRSPLQLEHKDIILVDDGIATGSTMEVVVQLLKKKNVKKITIAVPVASLDVVKKLANHADQIVTVITPDYLTSVGQWYDNFKQVETNEVTKILTEYSIAELTLMPNS
jgi:putative phosphoribosyl transferase